MPCSRTPGQVMALWLLAGGSGLLPAPVTAAEPLDQIQQRIKATRKTREALQSVRDRLDQNLADIERHRGQLARRLHDLETQSQARTEHIAELHQERERLLAAVRQNRNLLGSQLRSAYAVGPRDWLQLLLNQDEPSRLARVLAYYGYVSRALGGLIQRSQADLVKLRDIDSELAEETRRQAETQQQLAREHAALMESARVRRQLLAGWDEELKGQDAQLAQLKEDQSRLEALIQAMKAADAPAAPPAPDPVLQQTPPARLGRCPPAGMVLARFGSPRMTGHWDGMLIAGQEGTPVRAVAAGRVVFADWFRGYGLLMIVDQGDGVMSLYAFNQTLYKQKDDTVSADEIIAAIGASGGREQPGLYFGIREQGRPVDPLTWCTRQH